MRLGRLKELGLLGMNARNVSYIAKYNKRSSFPLVDDKLRTKNLAIQHGVAVPELFGVLQYHHQAANFQTMLNGKQEFALKPASGSGGDGIVVIEGIVKGRYRKSNGTLITQSEMEDHISRVLSGVYSLGSQPDQVILEYRVKFDEIFSQVSYLGVPDIRIIVFQGVPVMSMVRLPTRMSDGKANLHKGAIGVGINITTGVTESGVWLNNAIDEHPDTGHSVTGIVIPGWKNLLSIASRCYDMTGLGYLGVDIVLDREKGPLLLELNARPGLSIQIANRKGLLPKLKLVEAKISELHDAERRVRFSMEELTHH